MSMLVIDACSDPHWSWPLESSCRPYRPVLADVTDRRVVAGRNPGGRVATRSPAATPCGLTAIRPLSSRRSPHSRYIGTASGVDPNLGRVVPSSSAVHTPAAAALPAIAA